MRAILSSLASIIIVFNCSAQKPSLQGANKLAKEGKYRAAAAVIDQLIAANPNRAVYYVDKTNYLINLNDVQAGLRTLNSGITVLPDSLQLYDMRGVLLEATGSYKEAIRDFTTVIQRTNDQKTKSHLLANRGGARVRIREFDGAYADLLSSVKFDSTNVDALNNLAAVCTELNKSTESLHYLNRVIALNPTYAPAYVNIGFRYQGLGQHQRAILNFNKAIEINPEEALAYSNRSFSRLKTRDLPGAMSDINKSITLNSGNSYAYKIRALIEIENKQTTEACKDLSKALELGYKEQYGGEVTELTGKNCK